MTALAQVIPLKAYQKNRLAVTSEPRLPEPRQLYALVVLTLASHVPYPKSHICLQCQVPWPCAEVRLAYRLREGF
jgi:hypothetical protein